MSLDLTILLRHNEMVAMGQSNCHKLICFGDGRIWGVQPCLLLANDASSGRDTLSWFSLTLVGLCPVFPSLAVLPIAPHRAAIYAQSSPSRRNPCSVLPIVRRENGEAPVMENAEEKGEKGRKERRDKKG